MCGTGVGFSVERREVDQLPMIAEDFHPQKQRLWLQTLRLVGQRHTKNLFHFCHGQVPTWDVSKVREAGERLKTFGGRASGPEPLVELFEFTIETFKKAAGRRLTSALSVTTSFARLQRSSWSVVFVVRH